MHNPRDTRWPSSQMPTRRPRCDWSMPPASKVPEKPPSNAAAGGRGHAATAAISLALNRRDGARPPAFNTRTRIPSCEWSLPSPCLPPREHAPRHHGPRGPGSSRGLREWSLSRRGSVGSTACLSRAQRTHSLPCNRIFSLSGGSMPPHGTRQDGSSGAGSNHSFLAWSLSRRVSVGPAACPKPGPTRFRRHLGRLFSSHCPAARRPPPLSPIATWPR